VVNYAIGFSDRSIRQGASLNRPPLLPHHCINIVNIHRSFYFPNRSSLPIFTDYEPFSLAGTAATATYCASLRRG
jgi:hypothetical protein